MTEERRLTEEELAKVNAARAAAGRDPLGEDEQPDEQDRAVLEGETETPAAGV